MQVMMQRLLVIGAISLAGGVSGVALGNFVAGGQRQTGGDELAAYSQSSTFADERAQDDPAAMEPAVAIRQGPTSYDCQGCDAKLHPEDDVVDLSQTEPLPPYDPYEYDPYDHADAPVRVNGVRRDIKERDRRDVEQRRETPDRYSGESRYSAVPLMPE